jgi:hypothetical protein
MRKSVLLLGLLMISSLFSAAYSQNNCKVLKPEIDAKYSGGCKKGLADGSGEASGIDQYVGEFRKGLPDGTGTYTWHSGEKYEGEWKEGQMNGTGKYTKKLDGRDSVLSGIWENSKYIGEKVLPPFVIQYKSGIVRVSCVRTGDQPFYIRYKFARGGTTSENTNAMSGLLFQGSSGNESQTGKYFEFEHVNFPFEGKVQFNAPSALSSPTASNAVTLSYELRLIINQAGAWMVTIYY